MIWLLAGLSLAQSLDLDTVRQRAEDAAIAVERAQAERTMARADFTQAVAGNLPSVTGFASVTTGQGFTSFGFERPVQTQSGIGARGNWVLISPTQWAASESARQALIGRTAMLEWARVNARRDATTAYAAAWSSQTELAARTTAAEDARSAAEAVNALVDAGIRPRADGARATSEALTAAAELDSARWRATAACAQLLALIREEPDGDCILAEPTWNAPTDGPASHPALDASKAAMAGAKAGVWRAGTALGPTVTGSGTAAWYATDGGVGGFGWNAGVEASMPLVGSGSNWAEVFGSKAAAKAAALDYEQQERSLRVALASATARHEAAQTALVARRAALEATEEALTLVTERYRAGTASLTEWMDARRTRDAAAVALATADAELGTALAELEAARGVL